MTKYRKTSQSSSPNLTRISENSSSVDPRKEGSDSILSGAQVPAVNETNLTAKVRSRRKMGLKKPQVQKDLKFPETISNDQSNTPFTSLFGTTFNLKVCFFFLNSLYQIACCELHCHMVSFRKSY